MNRLQHYIGMSICVLCLCSAQATTYEDEFTAKKGSAYNEDINVWVYTDSFAKRFGMPDEWVDDELKGAYAVVFRVENIDGRILLPHKGNNTGMRRRFCILDVYFPDKTSMPWVNDDRVGVRYYTPETPTYLMPQTDEDWAYKRAPVGLGKELQSGVVLLSEGGYGNSLFLQQFNKHLYPGIAFVSLSMACTMPAIEDSEIQFKDIKKEKNLNVIHTVYIPRKFMKRLYDNWNDRHRNRAGKEYLDILGK